LSKRARRRQKRPNAAAKALTTGLYRPKVEVDRRKAARLIRCAKHKIKPEDGQ
jgi:stalled ribosome alternative rescue factor ArfA